MLLMQSPILERSRHRISTAAKWSLGLRIRNSTDKEIEKAFNDGKILRIHVMRPTWHFVMPEDIRWMTELTAPRVKSVLSNSRPETRA